MAAPLVLLIATSLAAQDDLAMWVQRLAGQDPVAAEEARRVLATAPRDAVPTEALIQLCRGDDSEVARRAASVLRRQGLAPKVRAEMLDHTWPALVELALDLADHSRLAAMVVGSEPELALAALAELDRRNDLDDALLLQALDGTLDSVGQAAARMLVLERAEWTPGLLDAVHGHGQERLLEALADRPRDEAVPWLRARLADAAPADRMDLLAAMPPAALTVDDGRAVVSALADPATSAPAARVGPRLPARIADELVGLIHAQLVAGVPLAALLPALHNASALGEKQVLGLTEVVEPELADALCGWLAARGAKGLDERIASALDGDVPLTLHLLRRASSLVDRPARVERLAAELGGDDGERAVLAFHALADAGQWHPAMEPFALQASAAAEPGREAWSDRRQRVRALLRVPLSRLPLELLRTLLQDGDEGVRLEACWALQRSAFPPELESDLIGLAATGDDALSGAAARAIARHGSPDTVLAVWERADPGVRVALTRALAESDRSDLAAVLDALWQRRESPFDGDHVRDELLLARAQHDDRDAAEALLARAPKLPLALLRRCDGFAPERLSAAQIEAWRPALVGAGRAADSVREELVGWIAQRAELAPKLLDELFRDDPSDEVRRLALGGLLTTERAARFHDDLRVAMGRPLRDDERDVYYEILAQARPPIDERTLTTVARMLLVAPLADPVPAVTDEGDSIGSPLISATVATLRRDEALPAEPFEQAAALAMADRRAHALSADYLGRLLLELLPLPRLREQLGPVVAGLVLAAPDLSRRWDGMAHVVLAEDAAARQDAHAAAEHFAKARAVLEQPFPGVVQRALLGERDVVAHALPEARLAARARCWAARAHRLDGDVAAARAALAEARLLARGDAVAELEVETVAEEVKR